MLRKFGKLNYARSCGMELFTFLPGISTLFRIAGQLRIVLYINRKLFAGDGNLQWSCLALTQLAAFPVGSASSTSS